MRPDITLEQVKELYGLYKQATLGDNTSEKPGIFAGLEARGKWDAWESKKGMSKEDAKQAYVDFVTPLIS